MAKFFQSKATVAALAVSLVAGFEGVRTQAYLDPVGIPTVCFGETRGVKMGDKYTMDQCKGLLTISMVEHEAAMVKCIKHPEVIPDKSYAAFWSFTYNVGPANFCSSTLNKKLNAGDIKGACNELPKWNKAKGITLPGLTNRRNEERDLCLKGVAEGVSK